jgi:hypothetical protein
MLLVPAGGGAAYYRGGGDRIQVEFEIRGHWLRYGRVATTQFCTDREGHRFQHRIRVYWGQYAGRIPPRDSTSIYTSPIDFGPGGRIRVESVYTESVYSRENMTARVRPGYMTGSYLSMDTGLFAPRRAHCRTDRYWRLGSGSKRTEPLRFYAKRIPGGHPPRYRQFPDSV